MQRPRLVIAALALAAIFSPTADRAASERAVDVVVDMSPAGRKLAHPTAAHPAYYLPIVGGYKELGALVAGETPPEAKDVVHLVAVELAKEGYLVTRGPHRPDIVLTIFWGYMNPQIEDFGDFSDDPTTGSSPPPVFFNQSQMVALVGGNTVRNLDLDIEREGVMQGAEQNRYFVMLSAYDFNLYAHTRKKVMLWQAKMSVPSDGVGFNDVLAALVTSGGPFLGRETIRPKTLLAPLVPKGQVQVGTPTVKGVSP